MLIEFIGCTSSGKSAISDKVADLLKQSGTIAELLHVGGSFKADMIAFPWFIRFFRTNLKFCLFAAKTLIRNADSFFIGLNIYRNFSKKMGMYKRIRKKFDDKLIIWDEGTIHSAHNLFVHVNKEPVFSDIKRFALFAPKPDLIVYVKSPIDVVTARTMKRKHRRIKRKADINRFLEHAYSSFEALIAQPTIRERLFIVENNNNGHKEIHSIANKIVANLAKSKLMNDFAFTTKYSRMHKR